MPDLTALGAQPLLLLIGAVVAYIGKLALDRRDTHGRGLAGIVVLGTVALALVGLAAWIGLPGPQVCLE